MQTVPENRKVSPSLTFFTIHGMQFGIGILGFQRLIAKKAGYDSWISVILAGIATMMIMWMIYKILEIGKQDLAETHQFIFGKLLGKAFNLLFISYFLLYIITILRTYTEIIQVWVFEDLNVFIFTLIYLSLCMYIVFGGFRTVVGMMFFSVALPSYLLILFSYTFEYADFHHFLPIFDHSMKDIILASHQMSLTYMGYEAFLIYSPFVKNTNQSKKWAYLALLVSLIMFLYTAVLTFGYFSEGMLQKYIWPTLTTWKIVHLPVVERFEYIGIANWCLIILPNTALALWCGSRLIKQTFKITQKKGVLILCAIPIIIVPFLKTRQQIDILNNVFGHLGFLINFIYIPFLIVLVWLAKKVKAKGYQRKT
ncbi:GerAB/ArcD/ProY family transporter [Heyndrickxia sporothermodurans]|nr:GerAB/ArcD/ProY family transporter [Heyndrickxia sporothermodurans]